jgi:hypothetical protein
MSLEMICQLILIRSQCSIGRDCHDYTLDLLIFKLSSSDVRINPLLLSSMLIVDVPIKTKKNP